MRVMLADDLPDLLQLGRLAVIRAHPPHDGAVAPDDRENTCFAAADDDVRRRETRIALIEPSVRTDVRRRVDVQPVEAPARAVERTGRPDRLPRVGGEPELVDVIARAPFPR